MFSKENDKQEMKMILKILNNLIKNGENNKDNKEKLGSYSESLITKILNSDQIDKEKDL